MSVCLLAERVLVDFEICMLQFWISQLSARFVSQLYMLLLALFSLKYSQRWFLVARVPTVSLANNTTAVDFHLPGLPTAPLYFKACAGIARDRTAMCRASGLELSYTCGDITDNWNIPISEWVKNCTLIKCGRFLT